MSIEEGYARYACDRPEKAHSDGKKPIVFLNPYDKRKDDWYSFEHTDENGVTTKYTICPDCYEKYQSVLKTWQKDFFEFIHQGEL